MTTHQATRSPLLRVPRALAVTSFAAACLLASCSPHLATAPEVRSSPSAPSGFASGVSSVDEQIVVTLSRGANADAVAAAYGAELIDFQEGFAVMLPSTSEELQDVELKIKRDTRVITVENNALLMPAEARQKSWSFDDGYGTAETFSFQPAVDALGILEAHAYGRGQGVKVAVLDTGIDPNHPLFAGHLAEGHDFIDNDDDPTDLVTGQDLNADGVADGSFGHGTHVAGIVMITAPAVQILPVRVLDSEGRGDVRTVAAGIRWAVAHGAQVINLSLGMLRPSSAISVALREAVASGVVVVASAGNWGSDTPQEYPATSGYTIAVGADDAFDKPASFTSYGAFVDLCAPGVGVRSAFPGGGYRLWSGTSMSAPFVTGTVAIIKQQQPYWSYFDILTLLRGTARPLDGLTAEQVGRLGAGGLDVAATLERLFGGVDDKDRAIGLSVEP